MYLSYRAWIWMVVCSPHLYLQSPVYAFPIPLSEKNTATHNTPHSDHFLSYLQRTTLPPPSNLTLHHLGNQHNSSTQEWLQPDLTFRLDILRIYTSLFYDATRYIKKPKRKKFYAQFSPLTPQKAVINVSTTLLERSGGLVTGR
jgi:hypothetical protein